MPKSRNRKNHKQKVESWKKRNKQREYSANKEIMKVQEKLMEEWKEKTEKENTKEEIIKQSQDDIKNPGIV